MTRRFLIAAVALVSAASETTPPVLGEQPQGRHQGYRGNQDVSLLPP